MLSIGIGVISYNRPKECREVCEAILNTIDKKLYNIQTICAVDSQDLRGYEWVKNNFGIVKGENKGIAVNKNRALKKLKDNNLVFLFEDDLKPIKPGWVDLYINAIYQTKMEHFNYIRKDNRQKLIGEKQFEGFKMLFYERNTAQLMVFTKNVIQRIGAFDSNFGLYGFEHSDYTRRCKIIGLCKPSHHDIHHFIEESDIYFQEIDVKPCLSQDTMNESVNKANKYYISSYDTTRIYLPFPEGEF
jgi:GT2 family glycosyltransferase